MHKGQLLGCSLVGCQRLMNLLESGFAVKLAMTLKGKDVGPIGPELKGRSRRGAQKHSTFWQCQYLQSKLQPVSVLHLVALGCRLGRLP